jgi:uncharacterized protein YdhG (YjbR/CyaY superfamily)
VAEKRATGKGKQAPAKSEGFTADEKAAMRERAKELRQRRAAGRTERRGRATCSRRSRRCPRATATWRRDCTRSSTKTAPDLMPKTWYGMPAYARDGKIVCFFQSAAKFGARYATFGFNDTAKLDDGTMWPTSFALKKLTAADEKKIVALVKKAVG